MTAPGVSLLRPVFGTLFCGWLVVALELSVGPDGRVAAQGVEGPALQIEAAGNTVVLSWPTSAPNYVAQSRSNLNAGGVWSAVEGTPVVSGAVFRLTLPIEGAAVYYRLSASCAGSDEPDALYADANCDGIDGDVNGAVFVAPEPFGSPAWNSMGDSISITS